MDQLAHLIIRVDGQGVEKANSSLEQTSQSAGKAEKAVERLENTFKRNSQTFIAMTQARAAKIDDMMKRQTQRFEMEEKRKETAAELSQRKILASAEMAAAKRRQMDRLAADRIDRQMHESAQAFIMGEQRRAAAAIEAERKIQEARQKTIDQARLENRFSGAAGGWGGGGGGGGGGTINGAAAGAFGQPKGLLPGINYANISSKVGPLAAGLGVGFGLNEIKNTIVEMEVLEARLLTVAGSAQKANEMFATLKILDRQLPHDIGELTGAFVNLVHLGLTPSEEALRSYSAISSASSKSIEDVVLAVSRGVANDYRRIRSLGVEAVVVGDKVKLTFNNISETVDRTKAGLEGYFIKLGQSSSFAEASANKMKTLAGSISNLDSAWKNFISSMSKGGVSDTLGKLVQGLTLVLDGWNYILTTFTRQVERAGEVAGHISRGEMSQAATKGAKGVASGLTFGISDAALDDKGAPMSLAAAKAPAAIKTQQEILDEVAEAAKEKYDKERKVIEMELRFANDFAILNQKYRDTRKEIDELEIEGQDAEFKRLDLKYKAYDDYSRKVRELENKKKTDSVARSASIRSRIEANWAEGDKRKADFEFFLGKKDGEESAIFAEHTKMQQYVFSMTAAGSLEEEKALEIVNKNTLEKFSKLAEDRKDILRREYEDRERLLQRAFKNGDVKEIERINKSKANWQAYVESVSKISVGGGTVGAPDPGDAPFFPSDEEMARKNRAEPFRLQDEKIAQLQADHEIELRMMRDLHDAGEIQTKEYHERMREEHRRYQEDLREIGGAGARMVAIQNLQMQNQVLGMAGNIAGQLDQLAQENSDAAKATFLAVKAISIAQAIVNTHLGATQALALGPYGIPMSTVILGMGYASAALMAATSVQEYSGKFADGGFLGGSQTTGDRVLFHGNAGEAVLNGQQQRNFMALANGQGGAGGVTIVINNLAPGTEVVQGRTNQGPDGKMIEMIVRQVKTEMVNDADTGGPHSRMLMARTNLVRTGRAS